MTFETILKPVDVKQLQGMRNLNSSTTVFRADRYFGEFTKSIGWAHGVHLMLTHALTFTERLETEMIQIPIPEHKAKEY